MPPMGYPHVRLAMEGASLIRLRRKRATLSPHACPGILEDVQLVLGKQVAAEGSRSHGLCHQAADVMLSPVSMTTFFTPRSLSSLTASAESSFGSSEMDMCRCRCRRSLHVCSCAAVSDAGLHSQVLHQPCVPAWTMWPLTSVLMPFPARLADSPISPGRCPVRSGLLSRQNYRMGQSGIRILAAYSSRQSSVTPQG